MLNLMVETTKRSKIMQTRAEVWFSWPEFCSTKSLSTVSVPALFHENLQKLALVCCLFNQTLAGVDMFDLQKC